MSSTAEPVLGADEKYQIAVSYGTIISTGLLAILVCCTRVSFEGWLKTMNIADRWDPGSFMFGSS